MEAWPTPALARFFRVQAPETTSGPEGGHDGFPGSRGGAPRPLQHWGRDLKQDWGMAAALATEAVYRFTGTAPDHAGPPTEPRRPRDEPRSHEWS